MKKLLLPVIAAAVAGFSASAAAVGDTFTIEGVTYLVKSDTTVGIDDVDTSLTEIVLDETVSYEGSDYTVVSVERDAFYWSDVTDIVLPSTVETLEYGAFRSSSLASIKLPEGLKSIGDYAFYSTKLASIDIPEGVESLGASCFGICYSLAEVSFPSTLKSIGGSCFYNSGLVSAALPEGLETLGTKAFLSCKKLSEVKLPEGITSIPDGVFQSCSSLVSIDIPAGVTSIGTDAFLEAGLSGVVKLPASLEEIGGSAFSKTKVAEFELVAGSKLIRDGYAIYSPDRSVLLAYPPMASEGTVTVLPECVGIGEGAFWGAAVTKVILPDNLRAIDGYAFAQSGLTEINFPESLVFIGIEGFAGSNIAEITLPSRLPEIQDATFAQCMNLKTVTIPSSVNYIDIRAFTGCSALVTVNALGTEPADLEDVYEAYEGQFYGISSSAVLNLRPGCTDAYKEAGWNSYFKTVSESLQGVIVPTGFDPADNAEVDIFEGVEISFGETVSVVAGHPGVILREGPLVAGTPNGATVSVTDWIAVANAGSQPMVFPADYDSYTEPVKMEKGKDYYLTIPAGVFKNSAGEMNEQIVLHYTGSYVEPEFTPSEISPADGSKMASLCNIRLTFPEAAYKVGSTYESTKIVCGELVDGVPVGETLSSFYDQWWLSGSGTNEIEIFTADLDAYTCPLTLEVGKDYYVVIPARSFRNSSWVYNKEIILHYMSNKPSGVEIVETAGSGIVVRADGGALVVDADHADVYTVSGMLVKAVDGTAMIDGLAKGVYVVRAVRGSEFKVVKLSI